MRESVCAYECKLSHACFPCISVWVLKREAIQVHIVADGKVDVNFATARSPQAFLYFFCKQNLCVEVMKKNTYMQICFAVLLLMRDYRFIEHTYFDVIVIDLYSMI